jgi:hypothetical protein
MGDGDTAADEFCEDRVVQTGGEHVQPPRVGRLEQHLHEGRAPLVAPQVGTEHREVDARDLVRVEVTVAGKLEVLQRRVDRAPGRAVLVERDVTAEERGAQEDRTLLTAMTDKATKATSMIQRTRRGYRARDIAL